MRETGVMALVFHKNRVLIRIITCQREKKERERERKRTKERERERESVCEREA